MPADEHQPIVTQPSPAASSGTVPVPDPKPLVQQKDASGGRTPPKLAAGTAALQPQPDPLLNGFHFRRAPDTSHADLPADLAAVRNVRAPALHQVALLLALLLASPSVFAAEIPKEIPLWSDGAPGSEGKTAPEVVKKSASGELSVSSIHNPSITPYLPAADKATGAAILVIPGGGHRVLAITHEGYNVAEWLSEHGIAAFVLKYRLARETNSTYHIEVEALADTQRAMRCIRARAQEWQVDPARIGAIGFSAGGELVNFACERFDEGKPDAKDTIERQPSRPNFQAMIYPGTSGKIQPAKGYPPAFLACSYTDRQDISEGLAEAYLRFKRAGVPAELHIYATGGHGFGLRAANQHPVGAWIIRFQEWMGESGFLKR